MKLIWCLVFIGLVGLSAFAQEAEQKEVEETIQRFFEGFHKKDSILMGTTVSDAVIIQTIGKDKEGNTFLKNSTYKDLIKGLRSIPADKTVTEKILSVEVQTDGMMAHAWTPYEFWFDGKFSHCGVNSFQLLKEQNEWKIIYLVDTRYREGCENQ
ncbi:nuclear transport factor 2 family protein [Ascidiimonas aurantiaca]|uniref:nuclear transport factor 2 family protein n=1 Tax=Ascidiimonas aurantiaca TaxID=1685432 RepID=UPI0030EE5B39